MSHLRLIAEPSGLARLIVMEMARDKLNVFNLAQYTTMKNMSSSFPFCVKDLIRIILYKGTLKKTSP